ncbi:hypothetical protein P886_1302 [Alteromonadaceae bacterium 2753L.S.0a.02]|nr:hypothetical protein P886_1302 [Alteromonadaceae bacterium 2753L.S.0a.02]
MSEELKSVTMKLSPRANRNAMKIQQDMDLDTKASAVAQSLEVVATLSDIVGSDGSLVVEQPDGTKVRVVIPGLSGGSKPKKHEQPKNSESTHV